MAALNIDQFVKSLEGLFKEVAQEFPDMVQTAATTAKALLKNRITNEGLTAEAVAFPVYSEGYKKFKEKEGKYTGKTNLTFTGRMLNSLKIVETGHGKDGYFATVGASGQDNIDKLNFNEEHYHNVLGLTKKEQNNLAKDMDADIQKVIDKKGFGK